EGPPVPSSNEPQVVAGPIVRKALLLHDDVAVAAKPGGPASDAIRWRMFVDVYDVWPLKGEPEWFRVGNRRPVGWVKRSDLLPWNTRLVVRASIPAAGAAPGNSTAVRHALPVVGSTAGSIDVATWDADPPW